MKQSKPLLSIIIVSYNTRELLEKCLNSVVKSLASSNFKSNQEKILNQVQDDANRNRHPDSSGRHPDESQDLPLALTQIPDQVRSDSFRVRHPDESQDLSLAEIIVVDNNSRDDSVEMLENLKLKIENLKLKIIVNNDNLGFAKANNQGIKIAEGKYIMLLNSDTKIVEDDFFPKIISFLGGNSAVGILGPKLIWEDGKIQPSGGYFPTLGRLFAWAFFLDDLPSLSKIIKAYHPRPKDCQKPQRQDWITGACFWVKKKVFDKIGMLDEDFFMYVEELEFCFRAKKAGFEVIYYPQAKLIHYGGKSGTAFNTVIGEFRGLELFYQKHQPAWQKPFLNFLLKAAAFNRFFFLGILGGNKEKKEIYRKVLESK